jgi:copper transport protein
LLYGDLSPIASGTRFGTAFIAMTLGYALVTAFLFLAWLTDRRRLLWPAFVLGLGFASGLSLSGHSAADAGSSWVSELADWIHLSAASLWVGGLIQLVAVVWPAAPELRREVFLRFSRYATGLVGLLLAAGVYLSIVRLPRLADLWDTTYGQILLVKLGLVSVALLWGAFHQFAIKPLLRRGATGGLLTRLPRSLLGESLVGTSVLLVAAILVDSKPPPRPAPAPPVASNVAR